MPDKEYVNPAADGGWVAPHGDRPAPKSDGHGKKTPYDNTGQSTPAKTDGKTVKPNEHNPPTSGYDDVSRNGDYGFKGTPKKRSPKI